ncbi:TetR/AcrR family transcriptional regulator (plasmid) [Polymorphobacter sp. PAMC 29334]|uniref:TetR/AcrR family transcriptional regulator n=1 Tax=Polymorphobacter sp. PAMC 29334 TaxID=2862331 RepID=UPI001C664078|nr:TetR/AcrR family transcriptional regulator [Polymorphobacter sp. PAMC 29334]QYE33549.1 TetR/AcrR family transcriptional regulator [Polymorphobacter sp. PAMC 29334]
MSRPISDRRSRKRLATRQAISDAATRLFMERGFDRVTVDEIAEAADVGRMTVFNHFPRKEDMYFDREHEARDIAFEAIRSRHPATSPIQALGELAHRMAEQNEPGFPLFADIQAFVETALASEALKARARQMRDDFIRALAAVLGEAADRSSDDAVAYLAAGLIASAWTTAFVRAHAQLSETGNAEAAKGTFLDLIDRGVRGTHAALADTPYAAGY